MKLFASHTALVLLTLAAGVLTAEDAAPPKAPSSPGEAAGGPVVEVTLKTKERIRGILQIPGDGREGFLLTREGTSTPVLFLWTEIEESEARRLQARIGLAALPPAGAQEGAAYRVRGIRLALEDKRVLAGVEDAALSTDTVLILKRAEGKIRVPRATIVRQEEADLALADVYTAKEIYDLLLQRYRPRDERQWEAVGLELMQLGQVDKAREVFRVLEILRRRELPVSRFYADIVHLQERLATTEAKVAAFEISRRVLDERYEEALGLLRNVESANHDEALAAEIDRLRSGIEALRERRLEDRLVDEGYTWIRSLLTAKAVDRNVSFAEAAAYADKALAGDAMERLAAQYHLDRPSVERIWTRRPHLRTFVARYGEGSWIAASPGRSDVEGWWRRESNTARFEYLEARFAEQSMRVVKVSEARCPSCGGQGQVSQPVATAPAGGLCPTCLGAKVWRVVYYR